MLLQDTSSQYQSQLCTKTAPALTETALHNSTMNDELWPADFQSSKDFVVLSRLSPHLHRHLDASILNIILFPHLYLRFCTPAPVTEQTDRDIMITA